MLLAYASTRVLVDSTKKFITVNCKSLILSFENVLFIATFCTTLATPTIALRPSGFIQDSGMIGIMEFMAGT